MGGTVSKYVRLASAAAWAALRWRPRASRISPVYLLCNITAMAVGSALFIGGISNTQGGKASDWQDAAQGVGLSVIAAGVTGFVLLGWVLATDTERNRIKVFDIFGIRDYFEHNTTPIEGEYAKRLNQSARSIDVLGLGVDHMRHDFSDKFESWASQGVVRILLIDPLFSAEGSSYAAAREIEEGDAAGSIKSEVQAWLSATKDLRESHPESFQIRLAKTLPALTLVKIDHELFWSPYLAKRRSGQTPTMLVRKGGQLYDVIGNHFDVLWKSDRFSRKAPEEID